MTKEEAGRLGGRAAVNRHRWTREEARQAGQKSAAARRCGACGKVHARGATGCGGRK